MPRNGNSDETETISISMPGWLLEEIDSARKRLDQQRSDFIRKAVRQHILSLKDTPEFWEQYIKRNPFKHVDD